MDCIVLLKTGENVVHFSGRIFGGALGLHHFIEKRGKCCPFFPDFPFDVEKFQNMLYQKRRKCCPIFPEDLFAI